MSGAPSWSPDGQTIAFDLNKDGFSHIYKIPANGGHPEPITRGTSDDHVPSWSRDGRWIYYWVDKIGKYETWRITVDGDSAEQITSNGGLDVYESFDGKWIYFRKERTSVGAGIWKKPVQGGEEILVIDHPIGYRQWTLLEDGIYFAYQTESSDEVKFYNFKSERTEHIVDIGKEIDWGLCVSPDRRSLIYTHMEPYKSNIMLIENFR